MFRKKKKKYLWTFSKESQLREYIQIQCTDDSLQYFIIVFIIVSIFMYW